MEIWLHYLGKYLYNRKQFEEETRKYGIQRSIAFRILPNFEFGKPVLLAYYNPKEKLAEVIGYFTINGLAHDLPKDLLQELNDKMNIISQSEEQLVINRRCGKYLMGLSLIVKDTLKEIIGYIREVCEKHGLNSDKQKYFLIGTFTSFGTPLLFSGIKFFRGYKRLDLKDLVSNMDLTSLLESLESRINPKNVVEWVFDYEKRRYLKKDDRIALTKVYPYAEFGKCLRGNCEGTIIQVEGLGFICDICKRQFSKPVMVSRFRI